MLLFYKEKAETAVVEFLGYMISDTSLVPSTPPPPVKGNMILEKKNIWLDSKLKFFRKRFIKIGTQVVWFFNLIFRFIWIVK